jgi:hypothetical protein
VIDESQVSFIDQTIEFGEGVITEALRAKVLQQDERIVSRLISQRP